MKIMMKALGCAVVSCCVEGCILIPCGWECESEKVVADRKDESGQTEKIIHKKMHLNLSVLTRQITERNHVKSPNGTMPNHRTKSRQITERDYAIIVCPIPALRP